ncbi:MAG: cytochrome C, partial [Casimicrobiaceae bacterium]
MPIRLRFGCLSAATLAAGLAVAASTQGADLPSRAPVPLVAPAADTLPSGPLGVSIRLGQKIMIDTQSTVKAYVGNGLTCANCHL